MWHPGAGIGGQCEGCTDVFLTHEAVGRGVEAATVQAHLLDLTVYGRPEKWEDSPDGWPRHPTGSWWQRDGRRHCCG